MSDEGMGRPPEAYEELSDPREDAYLYSVPVPYGYQAMDLDFEMNTPLNARTIAQEFLSNLDDKALARFMTTAVILYWSTGEGTDMAECLWKARELERETRP